MKKFVAIAFALVAYGSAQASTNSTFNTFAQLKSEAFAVAEVLRDGGVGREKEPCTFTAAFDGSFLSLRVESELLGGTQGMIGSDVSDDALQIKEFISADGMVFHSYTVHDRTHVIIVKDSSGAYQNIQLVKRNGFLKCGVETSL